jgi:hypothetical protein
MLDGTKGVQSKSWKSIPITLPFLFIAGPPIAAYKETTCYTAKKQCLSIR